MFIMLRLHRELIEMVKLTLPNASDAKELEADVSLFFCYTQW